jgi:hypothetical protein
MTRLISGVCLFLILTSVSFAKSKEFCGKRDGTAGNAALIDKKGNEIITLAMQGGDQALLEQADALVGKKSGVKGETGTQNGKKYCVVAELDEQGEPTKIIKAWYKK